MSAWKEQFIPKNQFSNPQVKLTEVRKLVLHWTANFGAGAENHYNYFKNLKDRYASAHIFVDKNEALNIIPLNFIAFHANDTQKRNADGSSWRGIKELLPNANYLSIGIEMCVEKDGNIHPDTIKRTEDVFVELCKKFNLDPIKDIVTHRMITYKNCPAPFVANEKLFVDFKNRVKEKMNPVTVAKVEQPKGDGEKLILSDSLKKQMLQALENMSDSTKHGKNALNGMWIEKLKNDELTVSESIALMYIAKDRGLI